MSAGRLPSIDPVTSDESEPRRAETARALDTVDRFVDVGRELARQQILARPTYSVALDHLIEVIQILLDANENMARWLNRFTQFDFRAHGARQRFLELVAEYRTAKSGPELRQMKWPCGDIRQIYDTQIRPNITDFFVQTDASKAQLDRLDAAFIGLGDADEDMVAFIYDTVVGGIDEFLTDAEPAVDRDDLDAAEEARLQFKVRARELSEHLERLGGGLADLVLDFARLAGRSVRLRGRGGDSEHRRT
jgi:hypothetical protein